MKSLAETRPSLLIIDADQSLLESYMVLLKDEFQVYAAESGEKGLDLLRHEDVHLVLLDVCLPDMSGIEVLRRIKALDENVDVIMTTAVKDVRMAVEAIKLGAYDYLEKPVEADKILPLLRRTLEHQNLLREVVYLRDIRNIEIEAERYFVIGRSPKMREIYDLIVRIADTNTTVLISGESGVGKEVIARAIHQQSQRRLNPFVAVNCAAISEHLIESELFGHERGAFTGAVELHRGKFELAHTGTLFLDEVGSMRLDLQTKLLRVLQEHEFERVGGSRTIRTDVRVIAASNQDLKQMVADRLFRDDLFYRLNVIPVHVPPLRDRREDIPSLVNYFLMKYSKAFGRQMQGVTSEALALLTHYHWPGNVRELENMIERLVVLSHHRILDIEDMPYELRLVRENVSDDDNTFTPTFSFYQTRSMERIDKLISLAATNDTPVLIEGEVGTGQEHVARLIFQRGEEYTRIFVPFNCAGISEAFAESELFGTEDREGLVKIASGGTLFLNEITDLPISAQTKLLYILQHGEIPPMGSRQPEKVQFRLVASTNKPIEDEIRNGRFRLDLYLRIALLQIVLPPLRAHPEDIPLLAQHFLEHYSMSQQFSASALNMLQGYSYPGNIKELEHIVWKASISTKKSIISAKDIEFNASIQALVSGQSDSPENELWMLPLQDALESFEKEYLKRSLDRARGNVSRAANLARIHRVTFARKLQKYKIQEE